MGFQLVAQFLTNQTFDVGTGSLNHLSLAPCLGLASTSCSARATGVTRVSGGTDKVHQTSAHSGTTKSNRRLHIILSLAAKIVCHV